MSKKIKLVTMLIVLVGIILVPSIVFGAIQVNKSEQITQHIEIDPIIDSNGKATGVSVSPMGSNQGANGVVNIERTLYNGDGNIETVGRGETLSVYERVLLVGSRRDSDSRLTATWYDYSTQKFWGQGDTTTASGKLHPYTLRVFPYLFCAYHGQKFENSTAYKVINRTWTAEQKDMLAYIFSFRRFYTKLDTVDGKYQIVATGAEAEASNSNAHRVDNVQNGFWRFLNQQTSLDDCSSTVGGQILYWQAQKYAEYANKRGNMTVGLTSASNSKLQSDGALGPFTMNYAEVSDSASIGGYNVGISMGGVKELKVTGKKIDGTEVDVTSSAKWYYTDKNKSTAVALNKNSLPTSNKSFYIIIDRTDITHIKINAEFEDLVCMYEGVMIEPTVMDTDHEQPLAILTLAEREKTKVVCETGWEEIGIPELKVTKSITKVNGRNYTGGSIELGDLVEYTFKIENVGTGVYNGSYHKDMISTTTGRKMSEVWDEFEKGDLSFESSNSNWSNSTSGAKTRYTNTEYLSNKTIQPGSSDTGLTITFKVTMDPDKFTYQTIGNVITWSATLTNVTLNGSYEVEVLSPNLEPVKFLSHINGVKLTGEYSREPQNVKFDNTTKKLVYQKPESLPNVKKGDILTYTIRVYNTGSLDYIGSEDEDKTGRIYDRYDGAIEYTDTENNRTYGWKNATSVSGQQRKYTDYLIEKNKKIDKLPTAGTPVDYEDLLIDFKVSDKDTHTVIRNAVEEPGGGDPWDEETVLVNYINITGKVWLDLRDGKDNENNNKMDQGEPMLDGIEVALFDENDQLVTSNSLDQTIETHKLENPTLTKNGGEYRFENILVSVQSNTIQYDEHGNIIHQSSTFKMKPLKFYVRFTYNGQEYEAVIKEYPGTTEAENSKAYELSRDAYNRKFAEITNNPQKPTVVDNGVPIRSYGYAISADNPNNKIELEYTYPERGTIGAKLNYFDQNGNLKDEFKLYARTDTYSYTTIEQIRALEDNTVKHKNLGVVTRNEFDLMLRKDLYEAKLEMKSNYDPDTFVETYSYNSRQKSNMEIITKSDLRTLTVQDGSSASDNYLLEVRQTDASTNIIKKVEVTYRISILDQTSSYAGQVTKIVDYYDARYLVPKSVKYGNTQRNISTEEYNNGTMILAINDVATTEGLNIDVTYEIDPSIIINNPNGIDIYNYAEILSYKTYFGSTSGSVAGKIDRDSAPGTFNKENDNLNLNELYRNAYSLAVQGDESGFDNLVKTTMPIYEDDADRAPGLTIKQTGDVRKLSGNVWEDSTYLTQQNERKANGLKEAAESGIANIRVDLVWNQLAADGSEVIAASTSTDANGNYSFSGYIPGNYHVKFTYGIASHNAGSEIVYNGQDYKSTKFDQGAHPAYNENNAVYWYTNNNQLSDAKDNWDRRSQVNDYANELTNYKAELLKSKTGNEFILATYMVANTDNMRLEIEYATQTVNYNQIPEYKVENIDFGIALRPQAQLMVVKRAETLKVVLQDSSIHANTNEATNNIAWIKKDTNNDSEGIIQVTLDENLISGANIEITYSITITNIGEVDYVEPEYYYTYESGVNIAKTRVDTLVDYPSNTYRFVDEKEINKSAGSNGWARTSTDELKADGGETRLVSNSTYIDAEGNEIEYVPSEDLNLVDTKLLLKDTRAEAYIAPATSLQADGTSAQGESIQHFIVLENTMQGENLSGDDLVYENMVEVIKTSNPVGRRMMASIAGNLNPIESDLGLQEADASKAEISSVLPPFGDTKILYVLGATALLILAAGIILIKKKVLK